MEEKDRKYQRLDGEIRPVELEIWHTFLALGLMGSRSKLPQKVMDFLTLNYFNELLKSF